MNKYLILFLLLVFGSASNGQNYIDYYNLANEAEHQFVEGRDLHLAKETFLSLNKKYGRLLHKDNFYLGILYYLNNDTVNGQKYLSQFVDLYGNLVFFLPKVKKKFPKLNIPKKAELDLLDQQNKLWQSLNDSVIIKTKLKPTMDSLEKYESMDQANRGDNIVIDKSLDLKIQAAYLNYLIKQGIPLPELYGDTYLTVLFHIWDTDMQKKYLDFFYDQLKQGKAYPFVYALITDRRLAPEETVYGAHVVEFSPKTSKEQVITNRKKIGMSPYYGGPNNYPIIFPPEN